MRKLNRKDLQWILRIMPRRLAELMKEFPNEIFVAGGFIRSVISREEVNDIDVFTSSQERAKMFSLILAKSDKELLYETDNAITVKGLWAPVQFIHRWVFDNPVKCVESFDFTISCAAVFWNKETNGWDSVCDEEFYADLAAKRLVYRRPVRNEDAGGSMLRVLKYYQRGYRIPLDSLGHVISRLLKGVDRDRVDMNDEYAVGMVIQGLLHEVDPAIDPNHIAHLPSEKEES